MLALDFHKSVLKSGDLRFLPELVDEVVGFAEGKARATKQPVLLVGISLGSLLALNILRRSELFHAGVLITGGDIAKIAQKLYPQQYPQSYATLAKAWQDVNMYTPPAQLKGKHILFVLHLSDKMIDPKDAYQEIERQQKAGNDMQLVERTKYDHIGTIITETVLLPKRTLGYIQQIQPTNNQKPTSEVL